MDRRDFLGASLGALAIGCAPGPLRGAPVSPRQPFEPLAPSSLDEIVVPKGYTSSVLFPWGHPLHDKAPKWHPDNTAADQAQQAGMHHDGIFFYPAWEKRADGTLVPRSDRGWLCINHEYTDDGLLHTDGIKTWSLAKVQKAQTAVGVSVIEVARDAKMQWTVLGGRRVHGDSPIEITGPARGIALMKTAGDLFTPGEREGTEVRGTLGNCGSGLTPWGTYLTCEENFQLYFKRDAESRAAIEKIYGIGYGPRPPTGKSFFGWELDRRFDADIPECRNHANRFGWVVEIDPRHPERKPAKRTALGRFRHESATVAIGPEGRVTVYMGDDQYFQYLYKFVSAKPWDPNDPDANWNVLDSGTLYAAQFDPTTPKSAKGGKGKWIPLTLENPRLRRVFRNQGQVCTFARAAAQIVKATPLDRPEWIALRPQYDAKIRPESAKPDRSPGWIYVSLTNNPHRLAEDADAPNPRAANEFGGVLRWREDGDDPAALTFTWEHFIKCGNRAHPEEEHRGDIRDGTSKVTQDFGSPDCVWVDGRDTVWVQTDVSTNKINVGPYQGIGNNQLFAVDPDTRVVRRFMTGPTRCEVTGITETPDGRTFFVNIQHPGEPDTGHSDPEKPLGSWPPNEHNRPRSATVVIQREDLDNEAPIGT